MKKKILANKVTAILSATVLALSLAACGETSAPAAQNTETAAEEPVAKAIDKNAFDSLVSGGAYAYLLKKKKINILDVE